MYDSQKYIKYRDWELSVVPDAFLTYTSACFEWEHAGSSWKEHGERSLAHNLLLNGRARSVLEFGGGAGSVSAVVQRGMREFNKRLRLAWEIVRSQISLRENPQLREVDEI